MKKRCSRILSAVLILAIMLGLAACGNDTEEKSDPQSSPEIRTDAEPGQTAAPAGGYAWKSEFVSVDLGEDAAIQPVLFTEAGCYAAGQVKLGRREAVAGEVEEYEGQFDIYGIMLYFIDQSGKIEKLPNYTASEPPANTENKKGFYSFCDLCALKRNPAGQLVALEVKEMGWFDGPDELYGWSEEEDSEGDYRDELYYEIVTLSADGTELSRAAVNTEELDGWLNANQVTVGSEGNLLLAADQTVYAVAPDGSLEWSLEGDSYISALTTLPDGTAGAMVYGDHGTELRPIDTKEKKFGAGVPIPDDAWSIIPGDESYDFYYVSGMYLYGFKLGESEPDQVLDWLSCDISSEALDSRMLSFSGGGTVTGMVYDYSGDETDYQLFTLRKVPAETLPVKQILTVAQLDYYPDDQITNLMVRFNRSHDNVRLEYLDYSQFNTEDDDSVGLTKFMTETMAGNMPDIIPTGQLPYKQLAARGLLEDLYPFIDADSELKREDFFANLLEALEVNGGLYQVVPGFSVETLSGSAGIVGDVPGWTYDDFNAALAKMPEGCSPLEPYITREDVLNALLCVNMDSFVDWTTGQVSFESDDFKQMLEFVGQFPEVYIGDEDDMEDTQSLIRQGRQMLTQTYLYSLEDQLWNDVNFGGKSTMIGWPTSHGVGSIMRIDSGFAMSRTCSNKEAVWEFFRGILTENAQKNSSMIPSNRHAFDRQLKEIMTPRYKKDENGNYLLDENGEKIQESRGGWMGEGGEEHSIYAMTQEQADEILEAISTCSKVANSDTSISDIVFEQVQGYFAGQKSVDEVARLIQSKANIYINEQR